MKKIFRNIAIAAIVTSGLAVSSCADKLDLQPENWYTPENFWKEKDQFEGFVTAMSQMFRANYPSQILFEAGDIRAGGLYLGTLADGSGSASEDYIRNQYDEAHPQFNTFGGWYGFIGNLNELIYRIEHQEGILDDNTANGLNAIAYGWRAFCYFQMYRMYGGLPLRLEPDVILGDYTASHLYMPRSTAEQTLAQIKSDIDKALGYFASTTYQFSSKKDYYWSKAATELLAGQVYLWSAKVATGDHAAGGAADVAKAKGYFSNVLNNYGYKLIDDYFNIWLTAHNSESIYSVCYSSLSDKTWYNNQTNFNWSYTTGGALGAVWTTWDKEGYGKLNDGTANRFGYWATKGADDKVTQTTTQYNNMLRLGVQRYQYKNAFFFQFDENDQRGDAFYPVYKVTDREQAMNTVLLTDFDPHNYDLVGTFMIKYRYSPLEGNNYWVRVGDMPIYRLSDAIVGMAECCNYEGDNAGVVTYINMLRKRAYGANWDEATYGYTAGSFKDNEVAILHESDKEFFFEGRRWWDLRRLTTVKDGSQTDHLVFQPEGCIGWGLPVGSSPWMKENDGSVCETTTPVLPTAWEYRLLWPVNAGLLGSDPMIEQNPGYASSN
ncbi:MAG: RagB/SusD family nutrient uptake outer membrane protein [Paramuribaculum sp.]|nr:RagB/SusD family nutrient uptake outer membrane protein [Paramuribaculum sp.]